MATPMLLETHDTDWQAMGLAIRQRYENAELILDDAEMVLFQCQCGYRSPIWRSQDHWHKSAANHYRTVVFELQQLVSDMQAVIDEEAQL